RERDEFLHELLIAALEVDLVDDVADAARGPEFGHERVRVVVALLHKLAREVERLLLIADFAAQFYLGFAGRVVAADKDDLVAGEEIELTFRIDAIDDRRAARGTVDVDCNVYAGHHGRANLAVKRAHGGFDVFVRPNVLAEAEVGAGQFVE